MKKILWGMLLCLAVSPGMVGCSSSSVPPVRHPCVDRVKMNDTALLALLKEDWTVLKTVNMPPEERGVTVARYNANLLNYLRRLRADYAQARRNGSAFEPAVSWVHEAGNGRLPLAEVYSDVLPAADVPMDALEEHFSVPGVGVPLVGIIPAEKVESAQVRYAIRTRGTVSTVTAVMEFDRNGMPLLRFIPRHRTETLRIGRLNYPLAGDFSAAIEVYWKLTHVQKDRFLGLLRPQKLRDVTGLSCMEDYNPDRIPVILTHGLLSSAGTFDNLVNRLLSDPEIRSRYQFWYFNYPTGVAWTVSAAEYRRALEEVRRELDPHRRNRNWDRMVVVGHSMGGLITHYSQCTEPWRMLEGKPVAGGRFAGYLNKYYVDHPMPEAALEPFRRDYFFRPVQAGLVVYMATPHRGAPLARYRIVTSLMKLVRLPENLVSEVINVATLQQDNLLINPRRMTKWFTSVGQLSPDSYSIQGLQRLTVRSAPTYSIIGDRGYNDSPNSSDGIVPYWSSHIGRGEETIVPADHSVQDVPETAEAFGRVLRAYAAGTYTGAG